MEARTPDSWLARNWGHCAAVLVAIASYLTALGGEPIWDDTIVFERFLPAFRSFADVFLPPEGTGELGQVYYRPFITASYLLDNWLYGTDSFVGHHLTTLAFHVLSVLGTAWIARAMSGNEPAARWAAIAAALCFAVHPVHVESVAQISGRSDTSATAFLLGSLLLLMHGRDRPQLRWPWPLAAGAFLAALFCKEVSIAGALLGALLLWLPRRTPTAVWWRFAWSYGIAFAIYLALRAGAKLGRAPFAEQSAATAVGNLLRAVGYDAKFLLLPMDQAAFVPIAMTPPIWFGTICVLATLVAGVFAWRGRESRPILTLAWCWLSITAAPSLALVFVKASEQLVAERYLYLPSVAVSLAFGWLVAVLARRTGKVRVIAVVVAILTAAGAVTTALRARIYRDEEAFWADTVARAPGAALPLHEFGLARRKAGRLDEAMALLQQALELYDDDEGRSLAQNTIGTICLERREWSEAERWFEQASATRPNYETAWFNLAMVYGMRAETRRGPQNSPDLGDIERCVAALTKAVRIRSNYDKARFQLARNSLVLSKVYLVHRRLDDARRLREEAK
ncbi:MAG: tetratricopeptide repeat protein, partial [Planctomycetes bacterium]|nr:tetratricopeptide repeat protein [Planctomycetota bacterium]